MSNIIEDAKYKIYKSSIMKYISPEKIEEEFQKIYLYSNEEDFIKEYGYDTYNDGMLEGFNRNSGSYFSPYATTHTVIHEILHGLSSQFDEQGHRVVDGIVGNGGFGFSNQVNEGCTDYLARQISGEDPRYYITGNKFFSQLEPIMQKYSKNEDILMQVYLTNDVNYIQNFMNCFGEPYTFENVYKNLLYFDDTKMKKITDKIDKNIDKYLKKQNRKEKIENFKNKFKKIFSKNKTKMLTSGQQNNYVQIDPHGKIVDKYSVRNFKTDMPNEMEQQSYYTNQKQQENDERC